MVVSEIVTIVQDLQKKGIKFDDNVSHKEGFWGQVCTVLGIPNNKNNRYRLQSAFHKVNYYFLGLSNQIKSNQIKSNIFIVTHHVCKLTDCEIIRYKTLPWQYK